MGSAAQALPDRNISPSKVRHKRRDSPHAGERDMGFARSSWKGECLVGVLVVAFAQAPEASVLKVRGSDRCGRRDEATSSQTIIRGPLFSRSIMGAAPRWVKENAAAEGCS